MLKQRTGQTINSTPRKAPWRGLFAFPLLRLLALQKSPKFKFWLAQRLYEIDKHETIEQTVEREMKPENLRYEIKDATGKWEEVNDAYFDGAAAKEESR